MLTRSQRKGSLEQVAAKQITFLVALSLAAEEDSAFDSSFSPGAFLLPAL